MSEQSSGAGSGPLSLPDSPNLDWLRTQAKRQLDAMRASNPDAKLADAQFALARQYGFSSWRALKAHVDALSIDGQLFDAARTGDLATLTALLDANPSKLGVRNRPYEHTLLHVAAHNGQLAAVELLLERGIDPNVREKGDNTYPMHWAAAAGHLDVVRRLADAGGDVVGRGDDHELEVIGWATCWDGCDDAAHRAIADFLVSRGARHHIFSAIAMNLEDEVRRIVAARPASLAARMSRSENNHTPLHFAVRMKRPAMVSLLLELGADPLAVDSAGHPAAVYASTPDIDREVMQAIRTMTLAELTSADRGSRAPRASMMDLVAQVSLAEWDTAERLTSADPTLVKDGGALHLLAKRGDEHGVRWLLAHGASPSARWMHWDAEVTPMHLAAMSGHAEIVRILLHAGGDPSIRDNKHDGNVMDWARYFEHPEVMQLLKSRTAKRR